jgi:tartrate dehydratase alpha subunit/fumarate hydratase class I-like protein
MSTLTASLDIQKRTTNLSVANEIFTQIMENLRNVPYGQLPECEDGETVTVSLESELVVARLGYEYVQELRNKLNEIGVRETIVIENYGDDELKRISAIIDYMDGYERHSEYFPLRSVTFIAKNGINH